MPTAASSDQTYRSLPCPNGWALSAGRTDRRNAVSRSTSVTESPTEWAASDSSAADPVNSPAIVLSTAIPTFAASARRTVTELSEGPAGAGSVTAGTGTADDHCSSASDSLSSGQYRGPHAEAPVCFPDDPHMLRE